MPKKIKIEKHIFTNNYLVTIRNSKTGWHKVSIGRGSVYNLKNKINIKYVLSILFAK